MTTIPLLLLALAAAPVPPAAAAQGPEDSIVRLRNGRMLIGTIEDHDLDGLTVVTARHGGRYALDWNDLFPGEADRLRSDFGYRTEAVVPTASAHRFILVDGEELVGRILAREGDRIRVRVREQTLFLPVARLAAPPEPVTVEAAEVLTPEQFYAERAPQVDESDRMAQYRFAQELEAMFALEPAQAHFRQARELAAAAGDDALAWRIDGALERLERTIAHRAEAEAIEEIRQLMHRERFTQAKGLIESFDERFPDSALRGEYLQLADSFEGKRDEAITLHLQRNWYSRVLFLLKRKALDREASVDQMMSWLESEVPVLVREEFIGELEDMHDALTPADVDERWRARTEVGPSPPRHTAGYGNGTWILGQEKARAGLDVEEEGEDDGKTEEQRELEERMERYLKNLDAQRRSASAAEEDVTAEDWWRRTRVTARFQFLMAYYAEFSGDYEITSITFAHCPTCGGSGVIESVEISSQGSQRRRRQCPTCHGVGIQRRVSFR